MASPNGMRCIDGRYYLINGRWISMDAKQLAHEAAARRRREGYYVRVVFMGLYDYALYEFPKG